MDEPVRMWTIGHSVQPGEALVGQLIEQGIELLVDVRMYPMSRRHPQFNQRALASALEAAGIGYRHERSLGGRRTPIADSVNGALRNEGFRGFADHMATDEFRATLDSIIGTAQTKRVAIMCAEAVPWQCHRSLISDALTARGVRVEHIVHGKLEPHRLTAVAHIEDQRVTYPALI